MKKLLLLTILISGGAWANCKDLNRIAEKKGIHYRTKYSFEVKGPKGHRAYFHSAPSNKCKYSKTYIIPYDSVIGYQEFSNDNHNWIYVMYGSKDRVYTSGWLKEDDLKISGRISPIE
ncbi:hypothetical protein [Acinetobacter sp. AG3]|uniref:hypothetical protein n=1 Tax=Acinetobacter sp. AG3 TaxID=2912245 RepID=UPI001EF02E44|nr:hypothetical protein [Acinetobacter sp. AG3]MCG7221215.1 hypothetical protein [Acinetobacter sp. AG3]